MRNSYIANGSEALNLHNGSQTAIVVAMKVQPTPPKAIYNQDDCKIVISDTDILQGGLYASRVLWNCKKHPRIKDCTVWENNLPYALGQEVYVRETFWSGFELDEKDCVDEDKPLTIYKADTNDPRPFDVSDDWCTHEYGHDKRDWLHWRSAATMPKSAARTLFKIVGCEGVRVLSLQPSHLLSVLKGEYKELINYTLDKPHINLYDYIEDYIITRFGQSAWDNNDYIWFYKI